MVALFSLCFFVFIKDDFLLGKKKNDSNPAFCVVIYAEPCPFKIHKYQLTHRIKASVKETSVKETQLSRSLQPWPAALMAVLQRHYEGH